MKQYRVTPGKTLSFTAHDADGTGDYPANDEGKTAAAFEDVLAATSTDHAPWYIVPANHKWYRNLVVAERVVSALEDIKLKAPPAPEGIDFATLKIA